ncbi:MAG TPA: hypothetical protein VJ508_15200, partial [Saprospiraceae bacterium]|nr:hypothetical protein [Saprospiraceae bacterium]
PVEEWSTIFKCKDESGKLLAPEELPLVKTLLHQLPYFKSFWMESLQGKTERISVSSYPIIGRAGVFVGAVAIFWRATEE